MSCRIVNLVLVLLVASVHVSDVRAECNPKYAQFASDHTACLTVDNSVGDVKGIDAETKNKILKIHNDYRAKQDATDMLKMFWDDEIAMIAQKHAERCVWGHDKNHQRSIPGRFSVGQNIAIGRSNWELSLNDWYIEIENFEYGKGPKDSSEPIGHYTAMVWAQSNALGCGFAMCNYKGRVAGYYVCNYGPAGNGRNMVKPYTKGTKGSQCMKKTSDGLCDCGLAECDNNGKMNTQTCQCECPNYPWILNDGRCRIDCSKISQEPSFFCSDKDDCYIYANMGADCPNLCNQCVKGTAWTTTTKAPTTEEIRTTTTGAQITTTPAPIKSVINPLIKFPTTCKLTEKGEEYMGRLSKAINGVDCQHWALKTPHYHSVDEDDLPDETLQHAENFCRNPHGYYGESKPWCYTSDPNDRWEFCPDIPMCKAECYNKNINGVDFAGTLSTTSSGKTCLAWSKQSRHDAKYMPEENLTNAKNYCRNPANGNHRLWCYTSEDLEWDWCDVPECP